VTRNLSALLTDLIDRVQGGLDLSALLAQLVQDGHQPRGVLCHLAAANTPQKTLPLYHTGTVYAGDCQPSAASLVKNALRTGTWRS
jgi:hypothetical protein